MNNLINTIQLYTKLDQNEIKIIDSKFKKITLQKNEFLSNKINYNKVLTFVNSGALHQIKRNNVDCKTLRLIPAYKFAYTQPKELQAIVKSSILYTSSDTLHKTFLAYTNLQNIFNQIIYRYMEDYIEEVNFLRTESLANRISYIKQKYPSILVIACDSIIASFLGVSRETYSRNKKKFL